jgi:hypothetical protein
MPLITLSGRQSLFRAHAKVSETHFGKGMKKDVFWGKVAKAHQSTNILPEAKEAAAEHAQELSKGATVFLCFSRLPMLALSVDFPLQAHMSQLDLVPFQPGSLKTLAATGTVCFGLFAHLFSSPGSLTPSAGGSCQSQYETLQHDVLKFIALFEAIKATGTTDEEIQGMSSDLLTVMHESGSLMLQRWLQPNFKKSRGTRTRPRSSTWL